MTALYRYGIAAAVGALIVGAIFQTGRYYERSLMAHAVVEQLQDDAEEAIAIEEKSDEQEQHTATVVKRVIDTNLDWASGRLPDGPLSSLCDAGLCAEGSAAPAGLPPAEDAGGDARRPAAPGA